MSMNSSFSHRPSMSSSELKARLEEYKQKKKILKEQQKPVQNKIQPPQKRPLSSNDEKSDLNSSTLSTKRQKLDTSFQKTPSTPRRLTTSYKKILATPVQTPRGARSQLNTSISIDSALDRSFTLNDRKKPNASFKKVSNPPTINSQFIKPKTPQQQESSRTSPTGRKTKTPIMKKRDELQMLGIILLQLTNINLKVEKCFAQQQQQAMQEIYNAWSVLQEQCTKAEEAESELEKETINFNLNQLFANRISPLIDNMMTQYKTFQNTYTTFAHHLSNTAHRISIGPDISINENNLGTVLLDCENVLQNISSKMFSHLDAINNVKKSFEFMYGTICECTKKTHEIATVRLKEMSMLECMSKSISVGAIQSHRASEDSRFSCASLRESLDLL
ncbi:hypothetical protein AKO1_011791 [Acrasis kona]|uniref:Uncharacterized protein n=1 Tax=Acrasis kona TaxID=1008807 RepID=A0AAW2Z7L5_9EUKA